MGEMARVCASCGEAIVEGVQFLRVAQKLYHSNHFVCAHCGIKFGQGSYFEMEGKPYCQKDYEALFLARCDHCNEPITGEVMEALEKKYHPLCFKCSACGRSLNEEFYTDGKKPLCATCHLPKCSVCDSVIEGEYIKAFSKAFHATCFHCADCSEIFPDGKFYQHEGRPYCAKHYRLKKSTGAVCAKCNQVILDQCIEVGAEKFHFDHFRCSFCDKTLMSTSDADETVATIRKKEGKYACDACAQK